MTRALLPPLAAAVLASASPAAAHEILHAVERGRAVAVRAYFPDGAALAYCEYEVLSPSDGRVPWQKGRTDRDGWLAFVPDVAGTWRVRVADSAGHALDLAVEAAPADLAAAGGGGRGIDRALLVARPLLAVAAIVGVFGLLRLVYRRPSRRP